MAEQVNVDIGLNVKNAVKGINKLEKNFDGFSKDVQKNLKSSTQAFNVFAGSIAANAVTAGLSAITSGFSSLFNTLIIDGVAAAQVQEDAINKLNIALKSTGKFTEEASKDFQEYASSIQQATKFGDEAILENAALIQSLGNLSQTGLKRATQAAVDLSAALGIDLRAAATLVGKAAAGEVSSFSRYGLSIKKAETNAKTFENALTALNEKFGGAAAGQVATFSGATTQLSNTFGDLTEEIGFVFTKNSALIGITNQLNGAFQDAIKFVQANQAAMQTFVSNGIDIVISAVTSLTGFLVDNIETFKFIGTTLSVATAAYVTYIAITNASTIATIAATVATKGFSFALKSIPFVAIGAAVALVVLNFDAVKAAVIDAGNVIFEFGARALGSLLNFTAKGIAAVAPLEQGIRVVFATIIKTWANTVGVIIDGAIKLANSLGSIFGVELPDAITNFKDNLLETADAIAAGGGSIDALAEKTKALADASNQAAITNQMETDSINMKSAAIDKETTAKNKSAEADASRKPASTEEAAPPKEENLSGEQALAKAQELRAKDLENVTKNNIALVDAKKKQLEEISLLEEEKRVKDEELRLIQNEQELLEKEEGFIRLEENLGREEALKVTARAKALETVKKDKQAANKVRLAANNKAVDAEIKSESQKTDFIKLNFQSQVAAAQTTSNLLVQATQNSSKFGKKAAIAQAVINGVAAVQQALNAPFPLNVINAALVTGLTIANVSKIKSAPAFQDGGIVPGSSFSGDAVSARVNSGEMILNRNQQTSLFNGIANGGVGGGGGITIQGNVIADDPSQVDKLIESIKSALENDNQTLDPGF